LCGRSIDFFNQTSIHHSAERPVERTRKQSLTTLGQSFECLNDAVSVQGVLAQSEKDMEDLGMEWEIAFQAGELLSHGRLLRGSKRDGPTETINASTIMYKLIVVNRYSHGRRDLMRSDAGGVPISRSR
jgi:hypothetical protein